MGSPAAPARRRVVSRPPQQREGPPDRLLVERIRAGSRDAAEELVRRYMPDAYRAAVLITGNHQMAEDAVQDGFEKALRAIDEFDLERPFAPWIYRIVSNRAIDLTRSHGGGRNLPLEESHVPSLDGMERSEASRALIAAMAGLPLERRVVVVLRLLFGYTPSEVAQMLEIEVGTVHSRLSRGLAQLRAEMEVSDEV